ncbi:MAG: HAMP domain-containing histidine kinase [Cyanobacterium sp. T60_A2020_053]|nr:HAMP domain-containing histidine kinase [Cyanobacterium sp. T60_A2020_053]
MDVIFDIDLVHTAKILELDRLVVIRFKYHQIINFIKENQETPSATIEKVFDCHREEDYQPNYQVSLSNLTDSPLISHGWQKAPNLLKLESKKIIKNYPFSPQNKDLFDLNSLQSVLLIPLLIKKENSPYKLPVLGFLILQKYHSKQWQIAEIETFKWIGKQISTTIVTQQTVAKVQSLVDERTSQLKTSLDVQAKLSNKLRFHLEELRRLNKIKDEFIASLSDALKTPLSNLRMGIKMLNVVNKNKNLQKYINILQDECEKEINLVNNLLALQQLQSNQLEIEQKKINIKPILDDLYNQFSQELHYRGIQLEINYDLDFIYTDANSINLILKELIYNATKFSVINSTISLILIVNRQQENYQITITNLGIEITAEDQKNIFQPFYQGSKIDNATNSGTGLGLALVKSLVENLQGNIKVSSLISANGEDFLNSFTLTFPQKVHEVF